MHNFFLPISENLGERQNVVHLIIFSLINLPLFYRLQVEILAHVFDDKLAFVNFVFSDKPVSFLAAKIFDAQRAIAALLNESILAVWLTWAVDIALRQGS